MLFDLRVATAMLELLVYCYHEGRDTLGESATVIPSVFDVLNKLQVTTETT